MVDTMKVEYKLNSEDFHDFATFIDKHKELIDLMGGNGEDKLSDQIKRQVINNEQLPEHFMFTEKQYIQMVKADGEGMKKMKEDNRVTVNKMEDG